MQRCAATGLSSECPLAVTGVRLPAVPTAPSGRSVARKGRARRHRFELGDIGQVARVGVATERDTAVGGEKKAEDTDTGVGLFLPGVPSIGDRGSEVVHVDPGQRFVRASTSPDRSTPQLSIHWARMRRPISFRSSRRSRPVPRGSAGDHADWRGASQQPVVVSPHQSSRPSLTHGLPPGRAVWARRQSRPRSPRLHGHRRARR